MEVSQLPYRFYSYGKEWDKNAEAYFFGARFGEPASGTFLSREPSGGWAIRGQSGNPRLMLHHNPESRIDPDGELAWWLLALGIFSEVQPLIQDLIGAWGPPGAQWNPAAGGQCPVDQGERDAAQRWVQNEIAKRERENGRRPEDLLRNRTPEGPAWKAPADPRNAEWNDFVTGRMHSRSTGLRAQGNPTCCSSTRSIRMRSDDRTKIVRSPAGKTGQPRLW